MQPAHNDRWDRTRRHLLRNFLVNPEYCLSPIPEEERSPPSSESGSLPDLVVEPVPNKHDQPPDFYEGLERRMKRYYRELFLGARSDDDDSADFEVNQSMCSTFMLDNYTRKDNEANIVAERSVGSDLDHSVANKRQLTKSVNEGQDEDEEIPILIESQPESESNQSNKTDDEQNVTIDVYDDKQGYEDIDDNQGSTNGDKLNRTGALNETKDVSKIIETKSDSDEAPCHRVSTTVAEIHERARDSTHVFDNNSPVLIPKLLQFSRRVFGSRINSRKRFNISEATDEFIRRLSSHNSDVSNKQDEYIQEPGTEVERLVTDSQLTRASLDSDKTIDTEKVVEHTEDQTQENDINKNDDIEDKILSEIQTDNEEDPSKLDTDEDNETENFQNASVDWNKDGTDDDEDSFGNTKRRGLFTSKAHKMASIVSSESSLDASFDLEPLAQSSAKSIDEVEAMREAKGSGVDESWHGEVDQDSPAALAFKRQTVADKLDESCDSASQTNASFEEKIEQASEDPNNTKILQNIAKIIDDFWSVSPMEVDIDEPNQSHASKRSTDPEGDATAKRRRKDAAIQTGLEEIKKWEDIRTEFFVGQPLVFRLCGCPDHVCS